MNTIRTFIALDLSKETQQELARIVDELKPSEANVKWVRPASIHLTLKFPGNITEDKIDPIAKKLEEIASTFSPFDIVLENIGVFPSWSRPSVVWVGIGEGSRAIKDIARKVEDALVLEGFEKETREFRPHLTIGRVKNAKNKNKLKELAGSLEVKPIPSHISNIVLYKSTITKEGAEYTSLRTFSFR